MRHFKGRNVRFGAKSDGATGQNIGPCSNPEIILLISTKLAFYVMWKELCFPCWTTISGMRFFTLAGNFSCWQTRCARRVCGNAGPTRWESLIKSIQHPGTSNTAGALLHLGLHWRFQPQKYSILASGTGWVQSLLLSSFCKMICEWYFWYLCFFLTFVRQFSPIDYVCGWKQVRASKTWRTKSLKPQEIRDTFSAWGRTFMLGCCKFTSYHGHL